MKAALFKEKNLPLRFEEVATPIPSRGQVLVKLRAAALNHRDLWIQKEQAIPSAFGIILGSDGSGIIDSVGEAVDGNLIGQEVIMNPGIGWGKNPLVQSDAFKFLGFPDAGTFSEYLVISSKQVVEKPAHLSFEEAAAVPLSGLTAYRALFSRARLRPGEKVLITGVGGGAATWALKFAVAFQAKVFITSGTEEKLKKGIELGALAGFNYKEKTGWRKSENTPEGLTLLLTVLAANNSRPCLTLLCQVAGSSSLEGPLGISLLFHPGHCFGSNFPSSAPRWVRKMNFFL